MIVSKSSKFIIIIFTVVILILLCILFVSGTINLNDKINSEDNNSDDEYKNYVIYNIDNKNENNKCIDIVRQNYYSYDQSYLVSISNITIDNKSYRFNYDVNLDSLTFKILLNDKVVSEGRKTESMLAEVCNYGKYIVFSTGWEGSPFYEILDTDGKIRMSFRGMNLSYYDGLLYVEELNKNDIDNYDDNEVIKYQLDMTKDNLEKMNVQVEKYSCDLDGPGYNC